MEKNKIRNRTGLVLVCPDHGAAKKAIVLNKNIPIFERIIFCNRSRENRDVIYQGIPDNLKGKTPIVVDDICDGGATFLALAQKLKLSGANKPYLFVSHGIFSKGTSELLRWYERIGTTNSIRVKSADDSDLLDIIKINW